MILHVVPLGKWNGNQMTGHATEHFDLSQHVKLQLQEKLFLKVDVLVFLGILNLVIVAHLTRPRWRRL